MFFLLFHCTLLFATLNKRKKISSCWFPYYFIIDCWRWYVTLQFFPNMAEQLYLQRVKMEIERELVSVCVCACVYERVWTQPMFSLITTRECIKPIYIICWWYTFHLFGSLRFTLYIVGYSHVVDLVSGKGKP